VDDGFAIDDDTVDDVIAMLLLANLKTIPTLSIAQAAALRDGPIVGWWLLDSCILIFPSFFVFVLNGR